LQSNQRTLSLSRTCCKDLHPEDFREPEGWSRLSVAPADAESQQNCRTADFEAIFVNGQNPSTILGRCLFISTG
jgi:hypothetical protein